MDPYRDRDILKAIAGLIRNTNQFDDVFTWGMPEFQGSSASEVKVACVEITNFEEHTQADDFAAIPQDRTIYFDITVLVRMNDPDLRDDEADRLVNVCANALTGQSILGQTVLDWTRIARGRWLKATAPERRVVCSSQCTYTVFDYTSASTQLS
jgi:hypothetical protein